MSRFSTRRARVAASLAAIAVSALALSACAGGGGSTESASSGSGESAGFGDITLQLSWIKNEEFAGEYFADSKGYYTEAGFDSVNLVPGPSGGVAELLSGSADIALSDSVSIGSAVANEGAPLKIIGATFQANPFTVLSLADGGNISSPQDLIGKKIGVQDSNMTLFNALLAANDIDPSEVTIVPVQYDPAPLVNGEVDGFIAYLTNEAISVEMEGLSTTNLPFADNGLPFVAETFTATDDTIASNREMLKAFLVAEIKGWTDALADPQAGADLAINEYGADLDLDPAKTLAGAEAQNKLIVSDETEENGLFTISDALQKLTIDSLAGAGITLDASDLFDLSLLAEVYEENPDLIAYAG
ncbi:ABC transporter substrate-binding protein [Microbacterium sp. cx-55]|uniref:ABC transporter substrate-binding protein n=1 Tax=unclassified Microbacterium TaxID=2609290 RepID=UPI001CBB926F|nr:MULTISPECIES: ABC transporter substrate-binding protein [unclassified Microbacterium]MBZ4487307.1 ABC transporter substrate-binding protein [Microbacterium sp. cx-55]MCC4908572.1 ABC transporter substrate-binding protein [Microbacterium sp. cx-59]UGB35329.1 ABC transporter substrate-binding protein [Microbacterium sp. cx-55]